MRRGFIFTLDALLSLILVVTVLASVIMVQSRVSQVYVTSLRSQSKYIAEDTLRLLRTVPLNEIVSPEKIEEWIKDGILDEELVNPRMTPLDIVTTYWATQEIYPEKNLRHKAEIILGYILNKTLPGYYYELMINNYTSPYLRKVGGNYSKALEVSPATLVMSGYAYNQTPRGYIARAYLTRVTTIREELYGWMRVLADADYYYDRQRPLNKLTITRIISLPGDAEVLEADGKFVSREGEKVTLYINGNLVDSDYSQLNIQDLSPYLVSGKNNITLVYSNARGDEIGSASGTTMYIKYKTSQPSVEDPGLVKVYDVTSERTGFMYLFELFVPGNITSIHMRFKVHNIGIVRLYYGLGGNITLLLAKKANPDGDAVIEFTNEEISRALSSIGVSYENMSKMVFDFVVGFDAYYYNGDWYYEGGDSYNDQANRRRRVYGYPDSYIRISYKSKILVTRYSIPLSIYFPYGDTRVSYPNNGLRVEYSLPPVAEPWYADFWVGYVFEDYTTVQNLYENGNLFYSGPLGRYAIRVAYTRLYNWMMVPGQTNIFKIKMTNGNSYVRDGETRGIIKYFIQAYAGYGDIFPKFIRDGCGGYNITYYWRGDSNPQYVLAGEEPYCSVTADDLLAGRSTYAVDDAIIRLFNNLGGNGTRTSPLLVKLPSNVMIDFASMGNIPGLFKPIQITLRVWREG
ncbi:hypothetical protein [Pyrococcus abyssi]|uniref:Uncharacterized protein n=1 Tax=Pyrococcus abyssi (strain GE5 / Orsay) TaxID=272844 RepID=Q9V0I1_PYRAB|nr:hypothetical protein [Pyrococcus abyssi]CAB49722.1 Hypothetical protein PAB1826 [Pyrococcus abyssi GE5]CCE70209.1 TPA: hypothetical protein PAB1826 [Pyrococcus abyssi GE5]